MKFKLLLLFLAFILCIGLVDAVNVQGFWNDDISIKSIEINEGESIDFTADVFTIDLPLDVYVALYNVENGFIDFNNPVEVYYDDSYNENLFHESYSVGVEPGLYRVVIIGKDNLFINGIQQQDSEELDLKVKEIPNIKPMVDDISGYNEGGLNGGVINFRVSFHDEDGEVEKVKLDYFIDISGHTPINIPCSIYYSAGNIHYGYAICPFDSTNIEFEDSVKVIAVVTDNKGLDSGAYIEGPFIINNLFEINYYPKIISSPEEASWENGIYTYDVKATDEDGDVLEFDLGEAPKGMSIVNTFVENAQNLADRIWYAVIQWVPGKNQANKKYDVGVSVWDLDEDGYYKGGYDWQDFEVKYEKEDEEEATAGIHKFSISNILTKEDDQFLDVYVSLSNTGNQEEDVELTASILGTNIRGVASTNLDHEEVEYNLIRLNKVKTGSYVLKVTAESDDYEDIRHIVLLA